MTDLKNTILNKIKTGEIQQTSRWYFITRDYVFYVLTVVTTVFGALAVSSILFQTLREHAPRVHHLPRDLSYLKSFMETMPWIWIVAFILLTVVAWFNYKHTARSYRHHNGLVVAVVLVVSLVGGVGLFKVGVAKHMEDTMRKHIPAYRLDVERREQMRERFIEERRERGGRGDQSTGPRTQRALLYETREDQ